MDALKTIFDNNANEQTITGSNPVISTYNTADLAKW